jgi:hypothetical protein
VSTSSRPVCHTPDCPRFGRPAIGAVTASGEEVGGLCPACDRPTDPPEALARWEAPAWSTISNLDGDLWHSWPHPELVVAIDQDDEDPDGRPVQVEVSQRDGLEVTARGVRVVRGETRIQVEDLALTIAAAEHLARVLMDAVRRCEDHTGAAR